MKILSLSDKIIPFIYSPLVRSRFRNVHLILGCGDLEYYYLEYVFDSLEVPLLFVRGNHDKVIEFDSFGQSNHPRGAVDLHRKHYNHKGLLLAGVEGSVRYRNGRYQYTQIEMYSHVYSLIPGFLWNRLRYGRFLDIFISHAPPAGIHDQDDLPHHGIRAFRWLIDTFQPKFFIHGHVHILHPKSEKETIYRNTRVINTFGYRQLEIDQS